MNLDKFTNLPPTGSYDRKNVDRQTGCNTSFYRRYYGEQMALTNRDIAMRKWLESLSEEERERFIKGFRDMGL